MKRLVQAILMIFSALSCSKDDNFLRPAELAEPTAMNVFCQNSPNDTLRSVEYDYDNDNLITETTLYSGEVQSIKTFKYNSDDQLTLEVHETDWKRTEKTFIYNELNQLINIIYEFTDYDNNGQVIDQSEREAPREYDGNKLIKEWEYWGGFHTYEYNHGRVVTKIDYTKYGDKHHITTFNYLGNLLIEEKKETKAGNLLYLKSYQYDSQNRLIAIKDRENIIVENIYIENRLIKKRTYYFGIDPGFDVCYGNYIYSYEY